jgi:hypothetical protein
MQLLETRLERLRLGYFKPMIEPAPDHDRGHGGGARLQPNGHVEKGRESRNVVSPKDFLEVYQVRFG